MELNRKFKNQWEKLHKTFHLIEILDFSFSTEFQNPEKLPENWQDDYPLMTHFNFSRRILTQILGCEFLHVQLIVNIWN